MDDSKITKRRAMRMLAEAKNAAHTPIQPTPESIEQIERQSPHATDAEKWRLAQAETLRASVSGS